MPSLSRSAAVDPMMACQAHAADDRSPVPLWPLIGQGLLDITPELISLFGRCRWVDGAEWATQLRALSLWLSAQCDVHALSPDTAGWPLHRNPGLHKWVAADVPSQVCGGT